MKHEAPEGWVAVVTACQGDPDMWFSDNETEKDLAKSICIGCPRKNSCKRTAVDNREKHGIWGGTDFSGYRHKPLENTFCRKGLHKLPEVRDNNQCPECRKATQKEWEAKQVRDQTPWYLNKLKSNSEHKARHKNVVGGKCKDGHSLVGDNIIVRSGDGAIVCKSCTHRTKVKEVQSGYVWVENMGSRNHG